MPSPVHVTALAPPEAAAAVELLLAAFRSDPTLAWIFLASEAGFEERLRGYFREGHRWHTEQGHPVHAAISSGELVGAAWAMLPEVETPPESVVRLERDLVRACGQRAAARFARYNRAVESAAPAGRFHVLALVAVLPRLQGGGIGRQLVARVHEACDADPAATGVLLDTAAPRALRFYERLGYRRVGEVRLGELRQSVLVRARSRP